MPGNTRAVEISAGRLEMVCSLIAGLVTLPKRRGAEMIAYDPAEWHELFVATAGATAALAGLLFIAISINLGDILKSKTLPLRAVDSLGIMVSVLIVSILVLTPGQSTMVLGLELLITGLLACGIRLRAWIATRSLPKESPQERRVFPAVAVVVSLAPVASLRSQGCWRTRLRLGPDGARW